MREVKWVIFDEVHYMRDKERGVVWEEVRHAAGGRHPPVPSAGRRRHRRSAAGRRVHRRPLLRQRRDRVVQARPAIAGRRPEPNEACE